MIFKNRQLVFFKNVCPILLLLAGTACNTNPVDHELRLKESNFYKNNKIMAIAQDNKGQVWMIANSTLCTAELINGYLRLINTFNNNFFYSLFKVNNKNLITMYRQYLIKITEDNYYSLDTLAKIDNYFYNNSSFVSFDDSNMIWIYDYNDRSGSMYLRMSNGQTVNKYDIYVDDSINSYFLNSTVNIAAGSQSVYIINSNYSDTLVTGVWDINKNTFGIASKIDIGRHDILGTTVVDGILHLLVYFYDDKYFPCDKNSSENFFLVKYKETALLTFRDSTLYLRHVFRNLYSDVKTFRKSSKEVYFYSEKKLIQVTDKSVVVKDLYSQCNGLFVDTSDSVIMYDDYAKKFINVSKLPEF